MEGIGKKILSWLKAVKNKLFCQAILFCSALQGSIGFIRSKGKKKKKMTEKLEKKPSATIRLILLANKAAPSPLLGQALGPYGINLMEFCKNFNNQTKNIKDNIALPVLINLYTRENYKITIKTPTTTFLIKQIANIAKGNPLPKKTTHEKQGFIDLKEIYHLAILKKCDRNLTHINLKAICKTIIGSIKSIGIIIKKQTQIGSTSQK